MPPASDPPSAPPRRWWGVWRVAFLLTALIFGLLLLDNHQYLFATGLYETTDHAADSLMAREAKHTFLLHGHYSQWRFYHPGPALIDTLAAGEALFFDRLHLVPTPYNGQLILLCLVMTLFFSLALSIFARRLGGARGGYLFFLPLALLFAEWHFGAVGGHVFLDAWPAYPLIMTQLCFLVASASVASGGGWELPVLVVMGSWLVHNHVAQPLFVVPLTLLAYAGLIAACRKRTGETQPPPRGITGTLTAGWKTFPKAHGVAVVLLALFVLPLFLDVFKGGNSNLTQILVFLHTQHDPDRKLVRSLCYFLTFGGYGPYEPGTRDFGHYSAEGMLAFVARHWLAYACWVVALVGAPALFLAAHRHQKPPEPVREVPGQTRFLHWFYVMLAAVCALTLVWGMRQEGPMYYYNGFFNYAIYYGLALGLAAALAVALTAWTRSPARRRPRAMISTLLWVSVAGAALLRADRFRVTDFGLPVDAAMARTVERAVAGLPGNAVIFVGCQPWENWPATIAVVLELARLGRDVRVNDNWEILFGNEQTIQHENIHASVPLAWWMIVPQAAAPSGSISWPLYPGCRLDIKSLPTLDPSGARIGFSGRGNYENFALYGWSAADNDSAWSDQRTTLLAFRPLPLPADATGVDLVIAAWSSQQPGESGLQRTTIQFNDAVLATLSLPPNGPNVQPVRIRIGAAQWQDALARNEARLQFHFPDAQSPYHLGLGEDRRMIGGGFRSIEFQPVFAPGGGATAASH